MLGARRRVEIKLGNIQPAEMGSIGVRGAMEQRTHLRPSGADRRCGSARALADFDTSMP